MNFRAHATGVWPENSLRIATAPETVLNVYLCGRLTLYQSE
jgi:hypothetical protein